MEPLTNNINYTNNIPNIFQARWVLHLLSNKTDQYKSATFYLNTLFQWNNLISSVYLQLTCNRGMSFSSSFSYYYKTIPDRSLAKLNILCAGLPIVMACTSNMSENYIQQNHWYNHTFTRYKFCGFSPYTT
jgi:hypothetical protein